MRTYMTIATAVLLFVAAGCGSGTDDNSAVGYNYWLLAEVPYTTGENNLTEAQREAAADLLVSRIIDFNPSLHINVFPAYSESVDLDRSTAESYVGQYAGMGGATPPPADEVHQGAVSYPGGEVVVLLDHDGNGQPRDVTIQYTFNEAEAQALVEFMTDWRVDNFLSYAISTDSVTAEVIVRGLDGPGSELHAMQELHVVSSHWVVP